MREIKFRAWSESKKLMLMPDKVNYEDFMISLDGAIVELKEQAYETHFLWRKDLVLMQFTGLKDRNGTEIYEGDIVRILYTDWPSKSDDNMSIEDYLKSISKISQVRFIGDRWVVSSRDNFYEEWRNDSIYPGTHGRIEIIGNIYANPELLKA